MTVVLAFAIWFGVSALFAPLIGQLLFSLNVAYPAARTARLAPLSRPLGGRAFARRRAVHTSWSRKPLVQSKFG